MDIGEAYEVGKADIVILHAPREKAAWLLKNRYTEASPPPPEGTDLEGAVAMLVNLDDSLIEIHPASAKESEVALETD